MRQSILQAATLALLLCIASLVFFVDLAAPVNASHDLVTCPLAPGTVAWCEPEKKVYFITSRGGAIQLSMRAFTLLLSRDSALRIHRRNCDQIAQCTGQGSAQSVVTPLGANRGKSLASAPSVWPYVASPSTSGSLIAASTVPVRSFHTPAPAARCVLTLNNRRYSLDKFLRNQEHPSGNDMITSVCWSKNGGGDLHKATLNSGNPSHLNILTLMQPFLASGSIELIN